MKLVNDDDNNRENNDVKRSTTSFSAIEKHSVYNGLRMYRDIELMAYAAKKITMTIFHPGGGI
jgi:hypothetical protein